MGVDNGAEWTFSVTIPSDTAIGSALASDLIDAMTQLDWPATELFRVQLAYEEAITNAIRHGNCCDTQKTVKVEMSCDADRVYIRITDQGCGFDPSSVPDPRQEEYLESPGGRGVLLISKIMSEVNYHDRGNQLTMIKIRGDNPPEDDD